MQELKLIIATQEDPDHGLGYTGYFEKNTDPAFIDTTGLVVQSVEIPDLLRRAAEAYEILKDYRETGGAGLREKLSSAPRGNAVTEGPDGVGSGVATG